MDVNQMAGTDTQTDNQILGEEIKLMDKFVSAAGISSPQ